MTEVQIKTEKEIPETDTPLLSLILNSAWREMFEVDEDLIKKRLGSGNLFLAAYDLASDDDLVYCAEHNIFASSREPIPVGLLETIAIRTEGRYEHLPKDYFALTRHGLWQPPQKDADTLILVDVTGLPTRTGKSSKGEVKQIVAHAKAMLKELPYAQVWTFTPDIGAVKKWHQEMGARDTGYRLPLARLGWKEPAVNIMDYSHFVKVISEGSN